MRLSWFLIIIAVAAAGYCFPLFRPRRPVLPVLLIGKTGHPFPSSRDKRAWLSEKKLEKLFFLLKKHGFTSVLPRDIISGKLPDKPVLLLFTGGYQTVYGLVFPLLKKYGLKAAVSLPAALIGQYDAWQHPEQGPWQNLLDVRQIAQLDKTGQVEFVSSTLDGTSPETDDNTTVCWKLRENKTRLNNLYHLHPCAVYFPPPDPRRPAVWAAARQAFSLIIGNERGNNILPTEDTRPLRVWPVTECTHLTRLLWKFTRP